MLRLARFTHMRKLNHFNVGRHPPAYQLLFRQHLSVPASPGDDKSKKNDHSPAHIPPHSVAPEDKSKTAWESVKSGLSSVVDLIKDPKGTWIMIKEVANHYWIGSKLLVEEIKIANEIVGRVLKGHGLTRRERMQLVRTTSDIFRLVPFAIFVIVPFMEFLLPFALKLFPNMLPSTFQDKLKKEESMKQELQMRLSVAQFMQETIQSMASKKVAAMKNSSGGNSSGGGSDVTGAREVISFIEKARLGEAIPNETVIRIAQLFKDELTLANVARPQLVSMCRYMNLQPYGADAILRFQLRNKFKGIKEDDRRILWEGIESLDTQELRDACQERGMRSWGLTHNQLKKQLDEWLSLSIQRNIPISLLIMSRAFMLTSGEAVADQELGGLKSSLSSLDSDTINEVVIAVAKEGEENSVDIKMRKLDSLQFQKEMIEDEREDTEDALEELHNLKKAVEATAAAATTTAAVAAPAAPSVTVAGESPLASLVNQGLTHGPASADLAVPAFIANSSSSSTAGLSQIITSSTSTSATPAATAATAATASVVPEAAVSSVVPTTDKSDKPKKKQLSVAEMKALSDMARGSSVLREKAELAILQATALSDEEQHLDLAAAAAATAALANGAAVDEAIASAAASAGTTGKGTLNKTAVQQFLSRFDTSLPKKGSSSDEDKSLIRMRAGLKSMLDDLKVKIDSTEKALGDSLNILDKDGDGQLSSDELKDAIVNILKNSSLQEAEDLIAALDSNKDGRVSLVELLSYIQQRTESSEVEALEAQIIQAAEKHHQLHDREFKPPAV